MAEGILLGQREREEEKRERESISRIASWKEIVE